MKSGGVIERLHRVLATSARPPDLYEWSANRGSRHFDELHLPKDQSQLTDPQVACYYVLYADLNPMMDRSGMRGVELN